MARMIKRNANDDSLFEDDSDEPRVPNKQGANYKIIYFLIPLLTLIVWALVAESCISDLFGVKGIEVSLPNSDNSASISKETFIIITQKGEYMFNGRIVSESVLRTLFISIKDSPLVIVAHQASPTESMIYLMDLARESGVNDISLAADQ